MNRTLLRVASWLVPVDSRADWLAEWRAELWHVERFGVHPISFCLGAFRDAFWLRRHNLAPRTPLLASPVRCLIAVAALAAAGVLVHPAAPLPDDVVAVRPHYRKTLTVEEYRALAARPPAQFTALAYYRKRPDGSIVASRSIGDVLRGAALPEGRYTVVDDVGSENLYVIARQGTVQRTPWRHVVVTTETGGRVYLDSIPLAPGRPVAATLMVFALAVLVLPAVTRLTSVSGFGRVRAWAFFAAKMAFALIASYYSMLAIGPHIRIQGFLVAVLIAVRWAFRDQQRRCPVCLRQLASPVSFGCLSHTLLEWHGSEFICPRGHGLLQVSATPSSPYAPQHWLPL